MKGKVTLIRDQHRTLSSSQLSRSRFKIDEGMTKGEFIHILKDLGNFVAFLRFRVTDAEHIDGHSHINLTKQLVHLH